MHEVDFIPVGEGGRHGDAIALRFTNPETGALVRVVIDAGFAGSGDALVEHFDRWYETRDVEIAILTHPDADHIGGMGTVVRELNVATLCVHRLDQRGGSSLPAAEAIAELVGVAEDRGTQVVEPFAGGHAFGGALQILGPTEEYYEQLVAEQVEEARASAPGRVQKAAGAVVAAARRFVEALPGETWFDDAGGTNPRNNSSAITLVNVGGHRMFFPADAGVPALDRALDWAAANGVDATAAPFVQMAHHGSRHNASSDLLNRLLGPIGAPQTLTAFVNVASEAKKHPSPRVANGFMRRGYRVFPTGGQTIHHYSADASDRGWTILTPMAPLDEATEEE